jgi:hypothetical protein
MRRKGRGGGEEGMIPAPVALAFLGCVGTSPSFAELESTLTKIGFRLDDAQGQDVRWKHAEGFEAFRQEYPSVRVCSVWFDQNYEAVLDKVGPLLKAAKVRAVVRSSDRLGVFWTLSDRRTVRLVTKEGESRRLGLALFVNKE